MFEFVFLSEKIVYGNFSGIDVVVISGVDFLFFIRGFLFIYFLMNLFNVYLVVVDMGIKG